MFDMSISIEQKVPIVKLACGGFHTAAIAPSGAVYTWGYNRDGALGRSGIEDKPMLVNLPIRATDLALGSAHSIFYSTKESQAFFCGFYEVRHSFYFRICEKANASESLSHLAVIYGRNIKLKKL